MILKTAPAIESDRDQIRMTCIDDLQRFRTLKDDWEKLYQKCPNLTLFNSWEWLFSWWQAYRLDKKLQLVVWRNTSTNEPIAIVPLYLSREKVAIRLECNVLRVIGDGSSDTDYLNFLIHPQMISQVTLQLSDWLKGNKEWDAFVCREMKGTAYPLKILRSIAQKNNWCFRVENDPSGAVTLPKFFSSFLEGRKPRFRTKIRSLLRQYENDDNLFFEAQCRPNELRRRLRSMFELHQSRWTQIGYPGVFSHKAKRLFYAHFAPRFSRKGWLKFFSLRRGKVFIAHQLCFGDDTVTYLLQEGTDISQPSKSSGQMLRALSFRYLIENGGKVYDFLGGYAKHKVDWGAEEHKLCHTIMARKNIAGSFYFQYPLLRERMVTSIKPLLPKFVLDIIGS